MSDSKPFVLEMPPTEDYVEIVGEGTSISMHSGRVLLLPGKDCGKHSTGDHEELIVVLSGEGELEVEGIGRTKIRSGMVAYNPPHSEHNVINTGKGPLAYIYIVAPTE
jgi:mannose-6-phosphate isomerase-like protein (cupin superfamily)